MRFDPSTLMKYMGYEKYNKRIFRGFLPDEFFQIVLYGGETIEDRYLPAGAYWTDLQKRFSSPNVGCNSLKEDDALDIAKAIAQHGILEKIARINIEKEEKIKQEEKKTGKDYVSELNDEYVQKDLNAASEPGDKFMVFLMYSIFQKWYEDTIHPVIRNYLEGKNPDCYKVKRTLPSEYNKNLKYSSEKSRESTLLELCFWKKIKLMAKAIKMFMCLHYIVWGIK